MENILALGITAYIISQLILDRQVSRLRWEVKQWKKKTDEAFQEGYKVGITQNGVVLGECTKLNDSYMQTTVRLPSSYDLKDEE